MASPRKSLRPLFVVAIAASGVLSVLPGTSSADPRPTLSQVQAQMNALNAKVDDAVEAYANAKIELSAASRRAAVAQARVKAAQAQLDAVKRRMGAVAAAAYRSGGADQFVTLVSTSTPQTFLDRAASLERVASGQSAQMAAAATARHRLANVEAEAAHERAAQAAVAKAMAKQKASIESALAEQQHLFSSLKADQQRKLRAAQRAAAARARASRSRSFDIPTYNGPASGRAAVAVQAAYDKLGSPYQWGASGPSRFDCSGLTMWSWGKAGVSLPHSSQAQYSSGQHVSRSDLQPGDLTFYGSPIHHVGIYIGNGRMISAPHSGDVVKIQDAFRSDYAGAVRP
ncbi:MAG: NlpC/P60 family protein [Mycobacteriales bacterium]